MSRKYRVLLSAAAASDVDYVYDQIARSRVMAARKWFREFQRHARSLNTFPERFEIIPEADRIPEKYRGMRNLVFGPYRILYVIDGSEVNIVRVVHGAQLLERALRQEPPMTAEDH